MKTITGTLLISLFSAIPQLPLWSYANNIDGSLRFFVMEQKSDHVQLPNR